MSSLGIQSPSFEGGAGEDFSAPTSTGTGAESLFRLGRFVVVMGGVSGGEGISDGASISPVHATQVWFQEESFDERCAKASNRAD